MLGQEHWPIHFLSQSSTEVAGRDEKVKLVLQSHKNRRTTVFSLNRCLQIENVFVFFSPVQMNCFNFIQEVTALKETLGAIRINTRMRGRPFL